MNNTTKNYQIELREGYVHLKLDGAIQPEDLEQSTDEIVRLSQENNVFRLLDDIRTIDRTSVTIGLQSTAIGLLWKLKHFKRIALVYKDGEIGRLVLVTLGTLGFASRCQAFDNEADAIAWLHEQ